MKGKILSVVSLFIVSSVAGYNLLPSKQTVQAQPVVISPLEMPKLVNNIKSVEQIDVEVNLETQEVSVKGATDKIVNVRTTGEVKPDTVVKWRTKVKEKEVRTGYPHVKSIGIVTEKPITPLQTNE